MSKHFMLVETIATLADLNFIYGCVLYGARKGCYAFSAENPEIVKSMKQEMQSVIVKQTLLDNRRALASVYSMDNKRIGLSILSDSISENRGIEIYAMSVARKYQNRGYGSQILDDLLNRYVYDDLYARCSPASQQMAKLLSLRGFELDSMDDDYRVLYRPAVDRGDIVEPMYIKY